MIIDTIASGKGLTQAAITEFASSLDETAILSLKIEDDRTDLGTFTRTDISSFLRSIDKNDKRISDDCKMLLANGSGMESTALRFDGANFKWWLKTEKRIDSFVSAFLSLKKKTAKKEKIIEDEKIYHVGVATLIDGELSNIHHANGTKSEVVEFINNDMFNRYIDETLKAKVVINLAFDESQFNEAFSDESNRDKKQAYKKDLSLWFTIEELEEMGAIALA